MEFLLLHDKVKDLLDNLDQRLLAKNWPALRITEIKREPSDQEDYYWEGIAKDLNVSEEVARGIAVKKPSWHLWYCAADFSSRIYTQVQKDFIFKYLKEGRPGPTWEIFLHDVGMGPHFHVAYEDREWKRKWLNPLIG